MNKVFAAMSQAGLAESNLKTVSVLLEPIREFDPKTGRERLRGYRANNRIQLTLLDPGKAGAFIDSAVEAGANEVAEIAYYLDDPGALRAKALATPYTTPKAGRRPGLRDRPPSFGPPSP